MPGLSKTCPNCDFVHSCSDFSSGSFAIFPMLMYITLKWRPCPQNQLACKYLVNISEATTQLLNIVCMSILLCYCLTKSLPSVEVQCTIWWKTRATPNLDLLFTVLQSVFSRMLFTYLGILLRKTPPFTYQLGAQIKSSNNSKSKCYFGQNCHFLILQFSCPIRPLLAQRCNIRL